MTNNLTLTSDWTPFLAEDRASTKFDKFLNVVKQLDDDSSPDLWTKWKNYTNQVVIGTPNYYFKFYEDDYASGTFFAEIRLKLAEIYREKFGIVWDVVKIDDNGLVYTFERRQKLTVCEPKDISYADLLLNWSYTLQELEKRLLLPELCQQLQPYIPELAEVKLIRDCINKYMDYAITEDGNIILLDDADWFLALVDKDGRWMHSKHRGYNVYSILGDTIFAPSKYFERVSVCRADELENKWNLFMENESMDKIERQLFDWREQMLMNNIKLITTQQVLPSSDITYFEHSKIDNCPKIGHQ